MPRKEPDPTFEVVMEVQMKVKRSFINHIEGDEEDTMEWLAEALFDWGLMHRGEEIVHVGVKRI